MGILKKSTYFVAIVIFTAVSSGLVTSTVSAHPKNLLFPLIGNASFSNDFNSPRSNGIHRATDIFAPKGTKIVAAVAGRVTWAPTTQPSYGFMVAIEDANGFEYDYIHMNNDTPGTDDGKGNPFYAYAPDIYQGATVVKGQLLGYVGDSGNAEETPSHLHFEIIQPNGTDRVNPYPYLLEAQKVSQPATYPPVRNEILPYGPAISTQPSIAIGRFDTTQTNQTLIGTGPGFSPHVKIMRSDQSTAFGYYAYKQDFTRGINVAAGDVDGDGVDEIITGTVSGAAHVKATRVSDGKVLASFYAYDPAYPVGAMVAAGDVDGDGKDEIVTAAGPGGAPHVKVFKPNGSVIGSFYAYGSTFAGGVDIGVGDVVGDTKAEIITSAGPGGSSQIRILSASGSSVGTSFNAYPGFGGGARVDVGNVRTSSAKAEIVTVPWKNGSPYMRMFNPVDGSVLAENRYYDPWWIGGYDVAAGQGESSIAVGQNRRTSLTRGLQ